jgi:hypothetical protein
MKRYLKITTGCGCALIAALLLAAGDASAQANFCFDIIALRNSPQSEGAFLLNRCTGQTWLLTRNGRRGGAVSYRWSLLATDGGEIGKPLPSPEVQSPAVSVHPSTGKCFSFQGRQFCD